MEAGIRTKPVTRFVTSCDENNTLQFTDLEPVLIKDCQNGFTIWNYPGQEFIVFSEGQVRSHCKSEKEAVKEVSRILAWREFSARKQVIQADYDDKLKALKAEYKGRI